MAAADALTFDDLIPATPKGATYGPGAAESGQAATQGQQAYALANGRTVNDPSTVGKAADNPSYDTATVTGQPGSYHVTTDGKLSAPATGGLSFDDLVPRRSVVDDVTGFMSNLNRGLGIGDELAAGLNAGVDVVRGQSGPDLIQTYRDELARQRGQEDSYSAAHPDLAALARGSGNALTMAAPVGPGAEAFVNGSRIGNALRGATVAGLTGAGYAAVDRGTPEERLHAASEAAMDPATLALGAGAGSLASLRPRAVRPDVPTLDQLTADKNAAYNAVDESGITIPSEDFGKLTQSMADAMDKEGFNAGLHPKAAAMLERIGQSDRGVGGYSPTLSQLDQLRQQIGRDVASSPDPGERRMGGIMRDQIDNYISTLPDDAGLLDARDLNTRVEKLRSLDNLDDTAARRAARTGSGGNKENALRQNVDRFITDTGNLTPDEDAAARLVVDGTGVGNALRQVGKLSPFGNGLGFAVHAVGGITSHGATLPLAGVGFASKLASEAITRGNVQALRDLIASGGNAASEVSRQLADPQYADLRAQLANDLAAQAGVQGTARRGSVTAEVEGHPEYGVGVSSR